MIADDEKKKPVDPTSTPALAAAAAAKPRWRAWPGKLKKSLLAVITTLTALNLAAPAQANLEPVDQELTVPERLERLRLHLADVENEEGRIHFDSNLLAQWPNWPNWGNWPNWNDWYRWNDWGNWGRF